MSLDIERIRGKCAQLRLHGLETEFPQISEAAVKENLSYKAYLDKLLDTEIAVKDARSKATMLRMSGLPAVKTLDSSALNMPPAFLRYRCRSFPV